MTFLAGRHFPADMAARFQIPSNVGDKGAWRNAIDGYNPSEVCAYLGERLAEELGTKKVLQMLSSALAYLNFIDSKDPALRPLFECVACPCSVIPDAQTGRILPCGHKMHDHCMTTFGPGAVCPKEGCGVPFNAGNRTSPESAVVHAAEVQAVSELLQAAAGADRERKLSELKAVLEDEKVDGKTMPINFAIQSGKPLDAVMALAVPVAVKERDQLRNRATLVVEYCRKKLNGTHDYPEPPLRKTHVKRSGDVSTRPTSPKRRCKLPTDQRDDDPLVKGEQLVCEQGKKLFYYEDKGYTISKFDRRGCPNCGRPVKGGCTVVSPVETDGKTQWCCSLCVADKTSREIFEASKGMAPGEEVDVSDML